MFGFGMKDKDYDVVCRTSRSPREALDKSYSFGFVDGFVAGIVCVGGYLLSCASSNKSKGQYDNNQY